jgi:VWFA-related protein
MRVAQIHSTVSFGIIAASLIFSGGVPAGSSTASAADSSTMRQPVSPQQDQQIPQSQKPLQVQTALVNLFVTVRDKDHAIVTNLKQEDFRVFEDNTEQKVAYFSKEVNLPITLAILVDTSGSQQHLILAEQDTASRFVHEVLHKNDEALVMSFDTDVDLLADFTEDTEVLEKAIRRTAIGVDASGAGGTAGTVGGGSGGGTAFYDAIYLAAHDKLTSEAGRKAIIALTDAEDNASKLSLKDAAESAQRADAVVHILLLAEPEEYFMQGMGYGGANAARQLADDTGGRVIAVRSEKSLEKAFDELTQELRSQYVIGYYPTNTKRDGSFRKIKVNVTKNDAKALTRKGYYAPTE